MYKDFLKELKNNKIDKILLNEPMKNHTTFKVGGPAEIMVSPENETQIIDVIKLSEKYNIPFLILGNGSNMLVRDGGIKGLVIKLNNNYENIKLKNDNTIVAQSGALLSSVSKFALKNSLEGMEFASGIPGSLGGAITMNAGAYGGEMKDVVSRAKLIDRSGKIIYMNNEELEFGYRESKVKNEGLIALEVEFKLQKGSYDKIDEKMKDLTKRRTSKQPLEWPSGGSTFKRPEGYYAGKLIDDSGLRGLRYKDAQVSEKHCGFIINRGNASCDDILKLIGTVQKTVKDKFNVDLEREIMLIGDE